MQKSRVLFRGVLRHVIIRFRFSRFPVFLYSIMIDIDDAWANYLVEKKNNFANAYLTIIRDAKEVIIPLPNI